MSWEDEDFVQEHLVINKFAGEDEVDAVLDSWDAEEEATDKKPEKKTEKVKPKLTNLQMKIIERELKEKQTKKKPEGPIPQTQADTERLAREMDNEAFGDMFEVKASNNVAGIDGYQVNNKADFDGFKELLKKKLLPLESNANYVPFLENLFRDLVVSVDVDNLRKLSSSFNILANEKAKIVKTIVKKKKGKAKLTISKTANDVTNYDDDEIEVNDDDDMD